MARLAVGILVEGAEGVTWESWRRLARTVDELGFESLWRSDHLQSNLDPTRDALDTWTSLAVAALETRRVRFGPLVCPITFRHPALLAKAAVAVDRLSGGRLTLGMGAGWNDREHRAFGIPFPPLRQRIEMLEEGADLVLRLQGHDAVHLEGKHFRAHGAVARPRPAQEPHVPLLIAGGGERVLRIAARVADAWDVSGGPDPDAYRQKNDRLSELCVEAGRRPESVERSVSAAYVVGRTESELLERAAAMRRVDPDLILLEPPDVLAALQQRQWRIGTPGELVESLRALGEAGAQRVILQHNDFDDFDALELLADEVLPGVADW